jgi:hypothetical protein
MPSLPVVTPPAISRTPLRGVALRQMLAMQSDDRPHAPPGRCSSLVFPRQSGHADLPLVCRTLRHAVRSGHCGQRGARATQIVAPRSMIAWLNR